MQTENDTDKLAIEIALLMAFEAHDMDRLSALVPCDDPEVMADNRFMRTTVC